MMSTAACTDAEREGSGDDGGKKNNYSCGDYACSISEYEISAAVRDSFFYCISVGSSAESGYGGCEKEASLEEGVHCLNFACAAARCVHAAVLLCVLRAHESDTQCRGKF